MRYHRLSIILALGLLLCFLPSKRAGAADTGPAGEPETIKIDIIYTNDIAGGIGPTEATFLNREFPPMVGGAAAAGRYICCAREQAEQQGHGFLLLDAGDTFQGTPVGILTKGGAVIHAMNLLGYDAMAIGNHEFDAGAENLYRLDSLATFPLVSGNVIDERTGRIAEFAEPYIIREIEGVKVAIIGMTTADTPVYSFPGNVEGIKFLPVEPAMRKYVQEVREKGADLVIGLVHLGIPYHAEEGWQEIMDREARGESKDWRLNAMELVHEVPGIDLMFCGHIEKGYYEPWEHPYHHTLMFQNYGHFTGLGHVTIELDPETKTIAGYTLPGLDNSLVTLFEDEFCPLKEMCIKVDSLIAEAEKGMDEPIGRTLTTLHRGDAATNLMGYVVVDAMLERTGSDFAFTNLGGVRAEIPAGEIAPRDVFDVLPFGNRIVVISMTGEFLKTVVEWRVKGMRAGVIQSGAEIVFNRNRPDFDRITTFKIGGQTLDPKKIYRVATTDYIAAGNIGLDILKTLPQGDIYYTNVMGRSMVEEYIRENSPINPRLDGRWTEDESAQMDPELEKAFAGISSL
jgi:2',3'-cyclic-nucleotide 2'-phosphodiesterase (5'-nucleotidase family)